MPRPPKNKVAEIVKPVIAAPGPARVIDVDNFIRVRDSVSFAPFNLSHQLLATTTHPHSRLPAHPTANIPYSDPRCLLCDAQWRSRKDKARM